MRKKLFALGVFSGLLLTWLAVIQRPLETTLPNGFVIRGYGDVLSGDRRTLFTDSAEFLCFNDRFLRVFTMDGSKSLLLDSKTQGHVDVANHPELTTPGGLLNGGNGCNGYYTGVVGPGLLYDDGKWPFLPSCKSVNWNNPTLKDRSWLARPCAIR
jgi:hypothetical protein